MKILVTGATGFVGQHLIPFLKEKGNDVYAIIRPSTDKTKVKTDNIFVFNDNICELADFISSSHVDGIIHLASLYLAQHQPENLKDLVESNVYFGTALLEAAVKANVKWFLNTGTIWQNYNVPDFSKEYCPVNLYAATKQAFIDIAKYYTETSKMRFCTLKLCDTYGPNDTRRKIFKLFKDISESGELLKMSPGDQLIDIVHIDDVLSGFIKLEELLANDKDIENEYVISSGKQLSLKELATKYEIVSGCKLNIEWGGRPCRTREVMRPWKGKTIPGWESSYSLEEGIKSFCKS